MQKVSILEKKSVTVCAMRLKRKMTNSEFANAIKHMRTPSDRTLKMAHADLVIGRKLEEIAKEYGVTKNLVCQASHRLWRGFLKSKGYEEISVVLDKFKVFTVKKWAKEASDILNREY